MFQEQISASMSVSTFPNLYHLCSGGNDWIVLFPLRGRGNALEAVSVCVIVLLERKLKRKGVSHSVWGVLKVDPRGHILVYQMNHQQGVAARCPPAPAHVSFSPFPRWWKSKIFKTATLTGVCRVCVFRLTSLIGFQNTFHKRRVTS